ncbi:G protein alpha subunit [Rhizoclosmatium globosum]|uniref:G protein alpha subunit n=1 Tax=Rhizoclosmatium globosum TaxID=329046 RepID=A0A1Y2CXP4_9FUNG|nr:G protein alpha subunit [Rhizoclosmatium globosum]|eukprot:ORY51666.1 G protein alpha subunit [Rhizoclosmatium globosum]
MGSCVSIESATAAAQSKKIDQNIKAEQRQAKFQQTVKMLLLGAGETGKSTILKQFKLIYGTGYTEEERIGYKTAILANVVTCAKALVYAMDSLKIPYGFEPPPLKETASGAFGSAFRSHASLNQPEKESGDTGSVRSLNEGKELGRVAKSAEEAYYAAGGENRQSGPSPKAAQVIRGCEMSFCFGIDESVPEEVIESIKTVWQDSGIQYCYSRANEFQLFDCCAYFLNDLDRITDPKYIPTDSDILNSRVMTTTITETKIKIQHVLFRVFDVGGQRTERKKWVPYFDDVDAIIYMVAISSYDQVLVEDNATNRLEEAMTLFSSICNHPIFASTAIIIFMNKIDIFKTKLKTVPITKYFPKFKGPNNVDKGSAFFASQFLALNANAKRKIYVHFTWATDTKQIKKVLATVYQIITSSNLKGAGM